MVDKEKRRVDRLKRICWNFFTLKIHEEVFKDGVLMEEEDLLGFVDELKETCQAMKGMGDPFFEDVVKDIIAGVKEGRFYENPYGLPKPMKVQDRRVMNKMKEDAFPSYFP